MMGLHPSQCFLILLTLLANVRFNQCASFTLNGCGNTTWTESAPSTTVTSAPVTTVTNVPTPAPTVARDLCTTGSSDCAAKSYAHPYTGVSTLTTECSSHGFCVECTSDIDCTSAGFECYEGFCIDCGTDADAKACDFPPGACTAAGVYDVHWYCDCKNELCPCSTTGDAAQEDCRLSKAVPGAAAIIGMSGGSSSFDWHLNPGSQTTGHLMANTYCQDISVKWSAVNLGTLDDFVCVECDSDAHCDQDATKTHCNNDYDDTTDGFGLNTHFSKTGAEFFEFKDNYNYPPDNTCVECVTDDHCVTGNSATQWYCHLGTCYDCRTEALRCEHGPVICGNWATTDSDCACNEKNCACTATTATPPGLGSGYCAASNDVKTVCSQFGPTTGECVECDGDNDCSVGVCKNNVCLDCSNVNYCAHPDCIGEAGAETEGCICSQVTKEVCTNDAECDWDTKECMCGGTDICSTNSQWCNTGICECGAVGETCNKYETCLAGGICECLSGSGEKCDTGEVCREVEGENVCVCNGDLDSANNRGQGLLCLYEQTCPATVCVNPPRRRLAIDDDVKTALAGKLDDAVKLVCAEDDLTVCAGTCSATLKNSAITTVDNGDGTYTFSVTAFEIDFESTSSACSNLLKATMNGNTKKAVLQSLATGANSAQLESGTTPNGKFASWDFVLDDDATCWDASATSNAFKLNALFALSFLTSLLFFF